MGGDDDTGTGAEPSAPAATVGGKYVPPSMRAGAGRVGESMRGTGNRDDLPTLRVSNISEETQEADLRDLFGAFGRVARVYVGRNRETGQGKGFAFVSFEEKSIAQKAMEKLNGRGYDNLILSVTWSSTPSLFQPPACLMSVQILEGMVDDGISTFLYLVRRITTFFSTSLSDASSLRYAVRIKLYEISMKSEV